MDPLPLIADSGDVPWWIALIAGPVGAGIVAFVWKAWDKWAAGNDKTRTNRIADEETNSQRLEKLLARVDQDRKDAIREREEVRKQAEQEREDMEEKFRAEVTFLRSELEAVRREGEHNRVRAERAVAWIEHLQDSLAAANIKFRQWVEPPAPSARVPQPADKSKPDTAETPKLT